MKVRSTKNPIIRKMGVCDPHIHIFNDRVYLYASHDAPDGEGFFTMHDWEIWSSDDMVNWQRDSSVRPEDFGMGASNDCWAVDAAEKDGKYYLYVSNGKKETWVLESDAPGKGFVEKLGVPVLPEYITPTCSYDPAVFVDDDGEAYIVFGTPVWADGDSYYIAKLNPDMVSLAEAPKKIILDDVADDKPFIHKHNGIYYLTWASYYATSDNIYGPYTTRGNMNLTTDHGSFFEWNGQWFMAFTVNETIQKMRRATGIAYIHYKENGDMCADQLIREYGVGQYDGTWNQIEAEWFMKGHGVEKKENTFGGFDVVMKDGSWIEFPNIRNLPENPWIMAFGTNEEDVDLEIYENDRLLGVIHKAKSFLDGSEFSKYSDGEVQLPIPAGDHSLKIVARGNIKLDKFRLLAD